MELAGLELVHAVEKERSVIEEKLQTPMLMLKESEWLDLFISSGLSEIKSWRSNQAQNWAGTLVHS